MASSFGFTRTIRLDHREKVHAGLSDSVIGNVLQRAQVGGVLSMQVDDWMEKRGATSSLLQSQSGSEPPASYPRVMHIAEENGGDAMDSLGNSATTRSPTSDGGGGNVSLMSALVPLARMFAASNPTTQLPRADSTTPTTSDLRELKPKGKRIRLKTPRRREQCRNNQARYRNKQRSFMQNLELGVLQLREEVTKLVARLLASRRFVHPALHPVTLELGRHSLCYSVQTKQCIWSVVVEYFRLFRYGFLMPLRSSDDTDGCQETPSHVSNRQEQLAFLRAAMTQDVVLGALRGVDALIEQWHRYSSYFGELHFELERMETEPSGAMIATATLSVTITDTTLRCVFPHFPGSGCGGGEKKDSQLCARLLSQRIDCRCSVRFLWDDEIGRVTRLETNLDLMTPLLRLLGSLEDVAYVLTRALITPEYVIGERKSHLSIAF